MISQINISHYFRLIPKYLILKAKLFIIIQLLGLLYFYFLDIFIYIAYILHYITGYELTFLNVLIMTWTTEMFVKTFFLLTNCKLIIVLCTWLRFDLQQSLYHDIFRIIFTII